MRFKLAAIGLLLSALFLWLAIRDVNFSQFRDIMWQVDTMPIVPFLALLALFYWLKAVRWRMLLSSNNNVCARKLFGPMIIGFAANNVFPFRAGEIIRVYIAGKTLDISKARILATVIVERVFDLLSVAIIVACGVCYLFLYQGVTENFSAIFSVTLLALGMSIAILVLLPKLAKARYTAMTRFIPDKFRPYLRELSVNFLTGLSTLNNTKGIGIILINSVAQWLLITGCLYLSFVALGIAHESLAMAPLVLGVIVLGISIPSTAAYIGTIEYAFVLGLGVFGINSERALAAGVYYHLLSFVFTTALGAIFYIIFHINSKKNI